MSTTMSKSEQKKDRKQRKTYPGQPSADNETLLKDIRVTLAAHQREKEQGEVGRKSVTPSPITVRESATPSPAAELGSPGVTRAKSRPSPVNSDRLQRRHGHQQMAQIRNSLKPHHRSDPGVNLTTDRVNEVMLQELIMKGYDQNSAVMALMQCGSASVDSALEILAKVAKKKLLAIREVDSQDYEPETADESDDVGPTADMGCQYDPADFNATHPSTLPGYTESIKFSDLSGTSLPVASSQAQCATSSPQTILADPDDISVQSSPEHSPQSSPPPEYLGGRPHVHVSPPPDVQPRTYSPFSAPFSSRMRTPPVYDRHAKLPHGYSPIVRPSSELSDSGIEEETVSHRNPVPPEAFKFYMEQHIENVLKALHQRHQRRLKLESEMSKRNLDDVTCEQMRKLLAQKESNFLRMKRAKMRPDMFDIVKPLGVGAFGVVSLVRKIDTNRLYAMKTLRKADVLRRNQVAHVKAERDILAEADNEWVVKLYYSFQDAECLYFVMEYIPGGDMMSLLIKLGTFPEHLTLFYIAELVVAIDSVHKMGFIHRDIKPDNILIGADGHIKLTDFGLCTGFRWTHESRRYQPKGHTRQCSIEPDTSAWTSDQCTCHQNGPLKPLELRRLKKHHRCVAHSLVGTPNYIAPEILRRNGYTQLCDWWSVGVIMYEMLVGQPPFMAATPAETQLKITNWPEYLRIPHHVNMTPASRDLIIQFLSDPHKRIGSEGAEEIRRHPFFQPIDWEVGIRNYVAPYKPKIMYDLDTSNFDPVPQSQLQKIHKQGSTLPKGTPEHAFYEFTFIRFATPDRPVDRKRPTLTASSIHRSSSASQQERTNPIHSEPLPSQSRKEKKRTAPQPVYV